jgi:hypothetical protein
VSVYLANLITILSVIKKRKPLTKWLTAIITGNLMSKFFKSPFGKIKVKYLASAAGHLKNIFSSVLNSLFSVMVTKTLVSLIQLLGELNNHPLSRNKIR